MGIGAKLRPPVCAACCLALVLGAGDGAIAGTFGMNPGTRSIHLSAEADLSVYALETTVTPAPLQPQVQANQAGFLAAIGIPEAWALLASRGANVTGTIAIVDTGIDLTHPMLAPYLTGGVNLLDRSKTPQDDNGHGTAVAGVLAEIADAARKSGGAAWQMKIMPVKALDRNGEGDEKDLAAGIRYAVDHGATIVVLSLGLRRDTPEMRDTVALAESKGVLLVAASGNDGAEFGTKAAVQYPAAYPTVLAVAGSSGRSAQSRSTSGAEVDVAAPWRVTTLKLGGGSVAMEGSSMSAPQAAGAAAMLRSLHPDWTPAELRDTLRRTAEDIAAKGWDRYTGYGVIRADLAVAAEPASDWHEPDDDRASAAAFPPGTELEAAWSSASDVDGYWIEVPQDGKLTVAWRLNGAAGAAANAQAPSLQLFPADSAEAISPSAAAKASAIDWPVSKGKYYLQTGRGARADADAYRLVSSFAPGPDPQEPNPNAMLAYTLAPRTQKWSGTFSSQGDEDWTVVTLPKPGKLRLRVDVDTTRIDPAITLQRAGENGEETDNNGEGKGEEIVIPQAKAGKYYIRLRNAVSANAPAVIGTYTVQLEYVTTVTDLQEPNDGPLTATPLAAEGGDTRTGLIDSADDADWFRFTVSGRERIRYQWSGLPEAVTGTVKLYGKQLNLLREWHSEAGGSAAGQLELNPGTYYLELTANAAARSTYYRLGIKGESINDS